MADDTDDSQKTEEPTQRKLDEALKRGQVIYSKEVTHFLILLSITIMLSWISPSLMKKSTLDLSVYIENSYQIKLDEGNLGRLLAKLMQDVASIIFLPLAVIILVSIGSTFIQSGGTIHTSTESITPKLDKISLMKGVKRLFSLKSFVELIKNLIKITVVGFVAFLSVRSELPKLKIVHEFSLAAILAFLLKVSIDILIAVCIIMAIIGALDYLYQRFEFYKSLRMSRQDLKDEYRETEGSPEIKSKLKSLRAKKARERMMAAVPSADVIITNPEHFSIALKYDFEKMQAPQVIAKGQDNIAFKIRELAKENNIPIVENPPLARALFATCDLEDEIPIEHYQAVAEIISYVFSLKGKKLN